MDASLWVQEGDAQIVQVCKKIQMNQKETFNSTVKDHHVDPLVSFNAVMISFTCGSISGPKMLSGGWCKRDSPYSGERRPDVYSGVFVAV